MTRTKLITSAAVAFLVVAVAAFFLLRPTPLDRTIAALKDREYFFVEDPDADPGVSADDAVPMGGGGEEVSVGPVAGLLTHDYPGRRSDLDDQPVYMFVDDEFEEQHGPIMPGPQPSPAPHAVFVYSQSDTGSVIAVPIADP